MSTLGERIKFIRKSKNLTQQKFADLIGSKQNTIATYEMDRNYPIDPILTSICREFNVNETWLRTGEGEPFIQLSRDAQISKLVGEALRGEGPTDQQRFLHALLGATPEELQAIASFARRLAEEYKKEDSR